MWVRQPMLLVGVGAGALVGAALASHFFRQCQTEEIEAYRAVEAKRKQLVQAQEVKRASYARAKRHIQILDHKLDNIQMVEIDKLPDHKGRRNPGMAVKLKTRKISVSSGRHQIATERLQYSAYVHHHEGILANVVTDPEAERTVMAYPRGGPRTELHFEDPTAIRACASAAPARRALAPRSARSADPPPRTPAALGIVTCGGLCPGLNNVIREIVYSLHRQYGCTSVFGIRGGYHGFVDEENPPFLLLPLDSDAQHYQNTEGHVALTINGVEKTLEALSVMQIHHEGGTVIASARGGHDTQAICTFLAVNNIQQLYVVGGDGTQRGALKIANAAKQLNLDCTVAGIPKTIDNDVAYLDRSFGFESAVEQAVQAVRAATVEARCNKPNGIGVVKLMGRSAGFIASQAALSAGDVDLCLVPECPLVLQGPTGCLPHLHRCVKEKGYGVVVVAEGAGEDVLGKSAEMDAGGNRKLPPIGEFMKTQINSYFKEQGDAATVKYIDPSYMVRSGPANAADSMLCLRLAQNAVHGSMSGMTGFITGVVHNRIVYLPMDMVVAKSPTSMNPFGHTWERVLSYTLQPSTRVRVDHFEPAVSP